MTSHGDARDEISPESPLPVTGKMEMPSAEMLICKRKWLRTGKAKALGGGWLFKQFLFPKTAVEGCEGWVMANMAFYVQTTWCFGL